MSERTYDQQIGERASYIRQILNLSQGEVAAQLRITRQSLSNYESGKTPMRASVVRSLCEIYGVPPEWLIGMTETLTMKSELGDRKIEVRLHSPVIPSPL